MKDGAYRDIQQGFTQYRIGDRKALEEKNAGLKAVTLIATLNPVSQVLW